MMTAVKTPSPRNKTVVRLDAEGVHYRLLNERIHEAVRAGAKEIVLDNVCGQRYIGDALSGDLKITIHGTPGNDLGVFMAGPTIIVKGNAQDALANTMNSGLVVVHGNAGDLAGFSMRGGRVFIRGNAGYRVGIHQKAYESLFPVVMIGGRAGDFLGEYMAGGLMVVLGLDGPDARGRLVGDLAGTGMHGGIILVRGEVDPARVGKEVRIVKPSDEDMALLRLHLNDYCGHFGLKAEAILKKPFVKLYPATHRPYGKLYAY
jgi:glutamate synthase domain-containing protein 3